MSFPSAHKTQTYALIVFALITIGVEDSLSGNAGRAEIEAALEYKADVYIYVKGEKATSATVLIAQALKSYDDVDVVAADQNGAWRIDAIVTRDPRGVYTVAYMTRKSWTGDFIESVLSEPMADFYKEHAIRVYTDAQLRCISDPDLATLCGLIAHEFGLITLGTDRAIHRETVDSILERLGERP